MFCARLQILKTDVQSVYVLWIFALLAAGVRRLLALRGRRCDAKLALLGGAFETASPVLGQKYRRYSIMLGEGLLQQKGWDALGPVTDERCVRGGGQWTAGSALSAVRFNPVSMVPDLRSQDRMGAIKELVDRMHEVGWVTDSLVFLQSVLDREDLESTVVRPGIAVPHARCRAAAQLGVALGISRNGIVFHLEHDSERVHLICLLAVPVIGGGSYLPLLGVLAGLFQDQAFYLGLLGCRTSEDMYRFLARCVLEKRGDSAPCFHG